MTMTSYCYSQFNLGAIPSNPNNPVHQLATLLVDRWGDDAKGGVVTLESDPAAEGYWEINMTPVNECRGVGWLVEIECSSASKNFVDDFDYAANHHLFVAEVKAENGDIESDPDIYSEWSDSEFKQALYDRVSAMLNQLANL